MLSIIFILNLLLNTGVFTVHSASDMHHKTSEENVKKSIQKNDRNLSYLNTNPVSNSRITNMSDKYTELQNQKLIFLYTMNTQTSDEFYFDYPNINKVIIEGVLQRLRNSPVSDNTSAFYSSFSKDRLIKRSVLTSDYVSSTTAASVSGSTSSSLLPSTLPPSTITAYDIDFVRVKIQGIIFDVKFQRPDYKSNGGLHLRNLMKPFQHLLLDPQYTEQVITTYNPLVMQNEICKEFENNQSDQHVTNTFFIVNDVGALVDRPMQDRLHRLFFQITSALGIPSITWLPTRVGQFELDDSQLAIRLEPLTWHVARGLVDFMQAYKWNLVVMVYDTLVPGSDVLVEEIRALQIERSAQDHPNYFEFEINYQFPFEGLTSVEFFECIDALLREIRPCLEPLLNILESIYHADARVIIFNGNVFDLNTLLYIADSLNGTKHEHLKALFGEDYVWIFTPSTMSSLNVAHSQDKESEDNNVLAESTMFKKIPGMFALICLNDYSSRKRSAEIAREVWQKSMIELIYQLTQIYPPDRSIQIDTLNKDTLVYFKQILEKLRPVKLCQYSDHLSWQWGRRMYDIMHTIVVNVDNEPITFLPNGGLNVSRLYIYNSRITDGQMKWYRVGTWSMSSKWGRSKSKLRIDGVTWPGAANSPPKGRPNKFKLRVVTIKEIPFVIYTKAQEGGTCDANSIPCKLRPESLQGEDISGKTSIMHKTLSSVGINSIHKDLQKQTKQEMFTSRLNRSSESKDTNNSVVYVNGCCSGLTMDLLMELMKDLNFEVEMFEVMDGFWGAWTPDGWNGIIRDLIDNRADMAVTSLKITPNRSQQIEFSVPFLETGIAVSVALREGAIAPTAFLKPYDYQCWCVILVFSVHATGAALYIYEWFSPNGMNRGRSPDQNHRFSFFSSLWLIWSMLFGAAVNAENPRGMASRFMANIWALFALVFLASYTANLAAFMIAKEDYFELIGVNDWRLQHPWFLKPPLRFATIPSGATEENIKINFPEMHRYMSKFNKSTVEEGLKATKSGQLDAFLYDANVLDYWAMKDEGCKLRTVGNLYAMTGYGIGFSKSSRWLTKINSRILDYQKNGKLQRWKKFWLTGSCKKDAAVGNANKTLGVKNFISAFILLVCGMLICTVFLLLEYAVYWYAKPKLKKLNRYGCFGRIVSPLNHAPKQSEPDNRIVQLHHEDKCKNPICDIKKKKYLKELEILRSQLDELQEILKKKNPSVKQHIGTGESDAQNKTIFEYPYKKKRTDVVSNNEPTDLDEHERNTNKLRLKIEPTEKSFTMMNNTKAAGASPAPVGKEKQIMMATTTTATKTPLNQSSKGTRQKVTIIPIANQISETQQAGNHDKLLTNGMETKYVILPKLESSPNRRRRFIKSQSTDPNSLVTCQTDFKFIAPNRSSMPTTQTISHNVNHNETHITPIQQNDVSISAISQTVESSLNNEELKPSSSLISIKSRETDLERQNRAEITKCLVEKESVL